VIAIISDTHLPRGARRLSPECLELLAASDLVLHAGDVTTAAVLDELRGLAPVEAVYGNVDEDDLRTALPERRVLDVAGVRIGMVHDAGPRPGRAERLVAAFPGCDVVVYGHTHVPELTRTGDVWIVNPGSPTERRRAPQRTLAMLQIADGELRPRLVALP